MPENDKQTGSGNDKQQSPGEILKKTRESRNLTLQDVSAQLNLQPDTLVALEEDDHKKLPVSAYVRGYLRSYARLLKLDPEDLLNRYDNDSAGQPEILPDVKKHTQISSRDTPVKAVTYLVTFVMALLLLAWLQSQFVVDNPGSNRELSTQNNGEADPSSMKIIVHPDTPYFNNRTDTNGEYPPLYDTEPGASDAITPAMELPDSLAADGNAAESTPAAQAAVIVLNVQEQSWIEVYDAREKRLYHGLAAAGEEIRINGEAPFSLLLGYAAGVDVKFKGKAVDIKQLANTGVARFNLGE